MTPNVTTTISSNKNNVNNDINMTAAASTFAGSPVVTVVGSQWGDEGKGKLVDVLAREADVCGRCQVGRR